MSTDSAPETYPARVAIVGVSPATRRFYRNLRRRYAMTRDMANFVAVGYAVGRGEGPAALGAPTMTVRQLLAGR